MKVKTNWLYPKITKMFGLGVYGPSKAKISKVIDKPGCKSHPVDILIAAFYQDATSKEKDSGSVRRVKKSCIDGFGYMYFVNRTQKKKRATATPSDPKNIEYCKFSTLTV